MKILVAIFAFIALSVTSYAQYSGPVNAPSLPLTVQVLHQPFSCAITGDPNFGTPVYGDGVTTTHTFAIALTPTTLMDLTPLKYAWVLTAANGVPDGGWSGATDKTTPTYAVSFLTPTYRQVSEDLTAQLDCTVDYVR